MLLVIQKLMYYVLDINSNVDKEERGSAFLYIFFKDFIYLFSERGEGREKERERDISVRDKHQLAASHTP